jgi:ABC transporter fused permease/ATP-binding protein
MNMIKKFLKLSRQEWSLLSMGLLFLAISSAALLAYPHFIKGIIDQAMTQKDESKLNQAALFALVVFVVQSVTSALRYYYFTLAGEKTVKRLRQRLFSQILGQDITFFDGQKTGELLGRLGSDTALLQNALSVNISMLVRSFVQAIGGIAMMFLTSPILTSFILIIIPPLGFLAAKFGKKVKAFSRKTQDALATSTAVAEESIGNVRTVKSFAQEGYEESRYNERLEASFSLSKDKIKVVANFTNMVTIVGFATIIFIVWYGGRLVIAEDLTVGTLTSFLLYVITVSFSVGMMGSLWTDFMSAFGASSRIFELLEKETEKLKIGSSTFPEGDIIFKDVTFSYPSRKEFPVLRKLNFSLRPQETVAVVGSSGAGKSTLVQLLLRLYEVDSGEMLIGGTNAKNLSLEAIRTSIGLVSQEPVLVSESLRENIRYGQQNATDDEVETAAKLAYAHDFIKAFPKGYDTLVGERGIQLSGGQKQRVAIARALLKNPKVLILDEATSALDSESEHLVQMALDRQLGKRTTLIIAHRLSTVKRADKILVMNEGQIVETGTHDELYKNNEGIYHKLVKKQFEQTKEVQ